MNMEIVAYVFFAALLITAAIVGNYLSSREGENR